MNEAPRIEKWLVSILKADTALNAAVAGRVYAYRVPTGAQFPLVLFNFQAGRDTNGLGSNRLLTSPLYQVKVIGKGALSINVIEAADRVDEILQNKSAETFENYVFSARREQAISYSEPGASDAEGFYRHLGGLYRIECSPI